MKYLALLPLVLVASCASRPQMAVRPVPPAAVAPAESLRYAEVVRAYHVGRQVDPSHPGLMAEGHPIYRIEVSSRWNLHPGSPNAATLLNPPPDAAFAPPPTNDVVIAELNRQREATALGLTGWVANQPDGSVRCVAVGPRAIVEAFVERLREGPPSAFVDRVELSWLPGSIGSYASFGVRTGAHRGD